MSQAPAPEGLNLILDSLNATTAKALELNQAIIQAKLAEIGSSPKAAVDQGPPPKTDDGGGQSN